GNASVADCSTCSGGKKVGNLYLGGKLTVNDVVVDKPGTYQIKVSYVSGDARSLDVSANGGGATGHKFPSTGDWGTTSDVYVPVTLKAGANTVTFDSGTGYGPDIDRIDVPRSS
ncbi:carbohydrate-binding protein, partial [Streptomyces sp. NPDC026672]